MKAKSSKGFFEAIIAGKFSYTFHPDFWTSIKDEHAEDIKRLYGTTLQFEELAPTQKLEEEEVKTVELSDVIPQE